MAHELIQDRTFVRSFQTREELDAFVEKNLSRGGLLRRKRFVVRDSETGKRERLRDSSKAEHAAGGELDDESKG